MISDMLRFPLSMSDDINQLFFPEFKRSSGRRAQYAYPPINMGTTDESVEIYLFVPGMKAEDMDIVVEKNLLSIEGERKLSANDQNPQSEQGGKGEESSYRQERFEGRFRRVITLPEDVDSDKVEASYKDGVLHITIPKQGQAQPRKIQISA